MTRVRWTSRVAGATLWAVTGCALGALTGGIVVAGVGTIVKFPSLANPVTAFAGGALYLTAMSLAAAPALALPVCWPILTAWAFLGGRLGRVESTYGGLVAATGALALLGGGGVTALYASAGADRGYRGAALVTFGLGVFVALWGGLLLPRMLIARLQPGAFSVTPPPDRLSTRP